MAFGPLASSPPHNPHNYTLLDRRTRMSVIYLGEEKQGCPIDTECDVRAYIQTRQYNLVKGQHPEVDF
jgi:hypothetical protein